MTVPAPVELSRERILAHRRRVGGLDERRPPSEGAVRRAVWAGAQDSMPRAAVCSLHARLDDVAPDTLDHGSLTQVWGPRFSVFVVAARDRAAFTIGRLAEGERSARRGADLADRLAAEIGDERVVCTDAARALGVHANELRHVAPTGRLDLRWDGARQPTIWMVPPPAVTPTAARRDLARRFLHVFGPSTATSFARWAGISPERAEETFRALRRSLVAVRTPIGDARALASDLDAMRAEAGPPAPARLLPSGDAYWLAWDADRALVVDDARRRAELWTDRVWPGAVMVAGEIVGTWRRSEHRVTVSAWRRLTATEREAIALEAAGLPVPVAREPVVAWR